MRSAVLLLLCIAFSACKHESTPPETSLYTYNVEQRIEKLGIALDPPSPPVANYVNATRAGNLIFLAGKGPKKPDGTYITGKVPTETSTEEAYQAARLSAIQLLSVLKAEIGDLNKVERVVEVLGMVNATADYTDHPKVINGCSDLLVEVFGDRGKHARAAVGMGSLPSDISCEIRMTVWVRE